MDRCRPLRLPCANAMHVAGLNLDTAANGTQTLPPVLDSSRINDSMRLKASVRTSTRQGGAVPDLR